jgi:hypothetical protein
MHMTKAQNGLLCAQKGQEWIAVESRKLLSSPPFSDYHKPWGNTWIRLALKVSQGSQLTWLCQLMPMMLLYRQSSPNTHARLDVPVDRLLIETEVIVLWQADD